MERFLNCDLAGRCGGCPQARRSLIELHAEKLNAVKGLFPTPSLVFTPDRRIRDRVDLTWQRVGDEMRLGLYALDGRCIVDLPACPMMSENLEAWFKEYRQKAPPIAKGSVRLRVSPSGERGVWLDFANEDVKKLFDEPEYLRWLGERAFVEIGQKRKALSWREDGRPKLMEPELKPWFETYSAEGAPIPLYGPVGGFSQPGFQVNRALVHAVGEAAEASGIRDWLELFCGNGNFTLALASRGFQVEAIELDELALQGIERSRLGREWDLQVRRGDLYLKSAPSFAGRGLLLDPPRAGLRQLLAALQAAEAPEAIVYVSCFTDVFLKDAQALRELGFVPTRLVGVDQFAYSPNCEWVGLFQRQP